MSDPSNGSEPQNFSTWKNTSDADISDVDRVMDIWHANFTSRFFKIVEKYQSKILMTLGGHSLRTELRVPESVDSGELSHLIFSAPSVSPLGSSNPGFSILEFKEA